MTALSRAPERVGNEYAALAQTVGALPATMAQLEQAFLGTADAVMGVTGLSEQLVSESERLAALAIGQDGGETAVGSVTSVLRAPLTFLEDRTARVQHVLTLLAEAHQQLRHTLSLEGNVRRITQPLGYLQTLFRIEASRFDATAAQKLHALVGSIDTLQKHVEAVFQEQFGELRATYAKLDGMLDALRHQAVRHQGAADRGRREVEDAIKALEHGVARSAERDVSLRVVSAEIREEIGRLVMALQYQDIVAQKMAHVRDSAEQMLAQLAALSDTAPVAARADALRFVQAAGQVVLEQIRGVEIEVGDADQAVEGAVRGIATRSMALDGACVSMHDVDVVSAGADGLVQVMLEVLVQARSLLGDGVELVERTRQVLGPVRDVAAIARTRITHVATGMHLIGLNAEVQAASTGQTGGLQVLAARLTEIAVETDGVGNEVGQVITELLRTLDEALDILGARAAEGMEHCASLATGSAEAERDLHALRDRTLGGLARVGELSVELSERLQPMLERSNYHAIMEPAVESFRAAVQRVVTAVAAEADELGGNPDLAALTAAIRSQYTMASERRIHDAAVTGTRAAPRRELRGGNVELFAGIAPSEAPAGGDVELWS